MDDFSIAMENDGSVVTLVVAGELDAATAPALDESVRRVETRDAPPCEIVIDLSKVSFIDSSGLSVLVAAHKRMRSHDAKLIVAAATPSTRRLFTIAGLDRVLTIRE